MKLLTIDDLEHLAIGAALLGSGGGGDPHYDTLMAQYALETYGPVTLLDVNDLKEDDFVAPLAYMGAPLVTAERLPSGREFLAILQAIEESMRRPVTVVMPAEIGGANAFTPLIVAAMTGLPLLDADTLGRAFPELQMSSCHLKGVSPNPAFLADPFGEVTMLTPDNAQQLEKEARKLTISMGSSAAMAVYLMEGGQVAESVVRGSYMRAIGMGKAMPDLTPFDARLLASGKIVAIDQRVDEGFLKGTVTIDDGTAEVIIAYQNEYLLAIRGDTVIAATPQIIMLLDQTTSAPICSESLQYGLRVEVISLPSPAIWKTPEGLAMVGPEYFGYELGEKPCV